MPELPEVETTLRGISPLVTGERIANIQVRQPSLRWPVTDGIEHIVSGQVIGKVTRRAKYLQFHLDAGSILVHLGMSGSLRVVSGSAPPRKHDHIELTLSSGYRMVYHDPRRFGSWLWSEDLHWQLENLGPEPLSDAFNGHYLYGVSRGRKTAVKSFLMTNKTVVGVGNIYASEALFASGIRPNRAAGAISLKRYCRLATDIKSTLERAILLGGTTLRDYLNTEGEPGYFKQELSVYGRAGMPCSVCSEALRAKRIGQRSSVYCRNCQR